MLILPSKRAVLGRHKIADQAKAFANVELMRPAAGVRELVFRQTTTRHALSHLLRYEWVCRQKMQQAAMVVLVLASSLELGDAGEPHPPL